MSNPEEDLVSKAMYEAFEKDRSITTLECCKCKELTSEKQRIAELEAENEGLKKELDRREAELARYKLRTSICANWAQISVLQGGHCYNCARRDGYPVHGLPDKNCKNYVRMAELEEAE